MEIKTEQEFNEKINGDYVLVDFFATWCGPCKMLGPILENVSKNIEVLKVDVDKFENLARNYSVMSIPTLILFKKGQIVDKKIGFILEVMLNEWINNNK